MNIIDRTQDVISDFTKIPESFNKQTTYTLKVNDIAGKQLFIQTYVNNQTEITLDVSSFKSGVYYLSIFSDNDRSLISKMLVIN